MTKEELTVLKRQISIATGRNMKDIEIIGFLGERIIYSYYESNYDRITHRKTVEIIILN